MGVYILIKFEYVSYDLEHDCIWCMACVSVCPPQAIKVDQSNLEHHDKAAASL